MIDLINKLNEAINGDSSDSLFKYFKLPIFHRIETTRKNNLKIMYRENSSEFEYGKKKKEDTLLKK